MIPNHPQGKWNSKQDDFSIYDRMTPAVREALANMPIPMSVRSVRNCFIRYDPDEIDNEMITTVLYTHMRSECKSVYGKDHPFLRIEDAKAFAEDYLRYRRVIQSGRENRTARRLRRLGERLRLRKRRGQFVERATGQDASTVQTVQG